LLNHGAKVDSRNNYGFTPLHLASKKHDESFLLPLINAGANVNAGDGEGETLFMCAARNGHLRTAKFLLDHGADANVETIWGLLALAICVIYGSVPMLTWILKREDGDLQTKDIYGQTVLHHAASHGSVENVAALLGSGVVKVDFEIADVHGKTVWDLLFLRGDEKVTALFEEVQKREQKRKESGTPVDVMIVEIPWDGKCIDGMFGEPLDFEDDEIFVEALEQLSIEVSA
jgi:ankyrin repeat protein